MDTDKEKGKIEVKSAYFRYFSNFSLFFCVVRDVRGLISLCLLYNTEH
jgi:hypothetical protein